MGTHRPGATGSPSSGPGIERVIPIALALGDGWTAINEDGGWRGVHPDGRQTHLHLGIPAVRRVIALGWFEGQVSPIAPEIEPGIAFRRERRK